MICSTTPATWVHPVSAMAVATAATTSAGVTVRVARGEWVTVELSGAGEYGSISCYRAPILLRIGVVPVQALASARMTASCSSEFVARAEPCHGPGSPSIEVKG